MIHSRKRKYLLKESDSKEWLNANEIILRFLQYHEKCEFREIFEHVNGELGRKNKYSRRGFSLRLGILAKEGLIGRIPFKQGHYHYYLTQKGEKNIELLALVYKDFAKGLFRSNFENTPRPSQKYFIQRMVERAGVYMLFCCIDGILDHTSTKKSEAINTGNIRTWLQSTNPGVELFDYFSQIVGDYTKYANEKETYLPIFQNPNMVKIVKDMQNILKKKYPTEYDFLHYRKSEIPGRLEDKKYLTSEKYLKERKKLFAELDEKY